MDNLIGINYSTWRELQRENPNGIDPERRGLARRLTVMSLFTSWRSRKERRLFDSKIAPVKVSAPLFIIGHWRSGTTLLHNLLTQDEQFAYPRIYEISHPHAFLTFPIDRFIRQINDPKALRRRRPMDNVEFDPLSPGEDEFATCAMSIRSHMVGWSYLRREEHYDRYLTFRNAPEADYQRWLQAFRWFLKKLTFKYEGKRLMLKSPQHTGRIRRLLQEFPDAQFVHIHRHPYDVFRSTQRLYEKGIIPVAFQKVPGPDFVTAGILRRYQELYDAFFEERALIPPGRYVEVSYDELVTDMVREVACIYEKLGLDGYSAMEPRLKEFAAAQAGYHRNQHAELSEALRQRIRAVAAREFEEWGYRA